MESMTPMETRNEKREHDNNDDVVEHRIICNIGDMIAWRMKIYGIALHDTQERIYLSSFNPSASVPISLLSRWHMKKAIA